MNNTNEFELLKLVILQTDRNYIRFHCGENYIEKLAELKGNETDEIHISGLNQESFEYFIAEYGDNFNIIELVHCNLIRDYSCFMKLESIEYILLDWNIRAERLWDMSNNLMLKGLLLNDTKKIVDLSNIKTAPKLEELCIIESVNTALGSNRYVINSLEPLMECGNLKRLFITAGKISDGRIDPLTKVKSLKKLHLALNIFEFKQYAELTANIGDVELMPKSPFIVGDEYALAVGRGRRNLKMNSPKLKLIQEEWDGYLNEYRAKNKPLYEISG